MWDGFFREHATRLQTEDLGQSGPKTRGTWPQRMYRFARVLDKANEVSGHVNGKGGGSVSSGDIALQQTLSRSDGASPLGW